MRTWTKRGLLALAALTGVTAGLLPVVGHAEAPDPGGSGGTGGTVVRTESGAVRGTENAGTRSFQGIPYAAPPVGDMRWQDPRPAARWEGERDASKPGTPCAQAPGEVAEGSLSEDCLYLNVTSPSGTKKGPKPVIVWVHGGGYFMGTGSNYGPQRLAEQGDAVVVTINYRLGVFGYFGHSGLKGSGTYGLADQQAAFAWVRRNAAAFGGDPGNVTVAGQSAGAISNCAHLTSPSATGLFDKAITQSGACDLDWLANLEFRGDQEAAIFEPLSTVEARGRETATGAGCPEGDDAETIECLRGLPVEELLKSQGKFIRPAYGTRVLPTHPADAVRRGWFHRVPVLSGQTHDESTASTAVYDQGPGENQRQPMTEQTFDEVMTETFGKDEAKVRAEYPREAYDSAALAWSAIATDRKWTCNQLTTSRNLSRHVPVFHYEYADPQAPPLSPAPPQMPMGAQHASDLWSLFDLFGFPAPLDPAQQQLSERMIGYWSEFAATGRPGADWPEFERKDKPPYVQSLAPGEGGVGPVDLAAEHHCGFWSKFDR
ncbi:hypothetical protein CFN78_10050 [Amycolatopsis antarctica]|uniref:Carboxylic ester hydrolase n=1 Tax=Amycolatopsis antarctica TaxID=1854586 RepID=A0A263D3Z2_9PSEU|nr:carboxylesterase family protein [Amycolatopsis antarctica]OZM73204.1 hypothetical protein CFN78_10050 [Amycolatopsis antarctica]